MEAIATAANVFLHIDTYLETILKQYGTLTYVLLFIVILCETGLVVTPFLPGDSLIFAAGTFAGRGMMNLSVLFLILSVAAIVGDSVNFAIGKRFGTAIERLHSRFIRQEYLDRTKQFYARHGGKTIVIARFMPIIRTFAPFVAGIGQMAYLRFVAYNIAGGLLWVVLFLGAGFFFGSVPFVEKHFSAVILGIIFVSILPGIVGWLRAKMRRKTNS